MLLVLNLPLIAVWVKLLQIPAPILYAGILVFATMGTIAAKPSVVELSMLAGFGVMGFLMRRFDFPIAPVVIGLILGPIAESQLRRALAISLGDPMTLLQSPMSATLLGIALIALLAPFVMKGLGPCMDHVTLVAPPAGCSVNSVMLCPSNGLMKSS
jgi:putative tricarboxylic transport membrane protein